MHGGPPQSRAKLRCANQAPKCAPAGIGSGINAAGIALALGGGFSRGFAHLGVLEVLEQEQIPVSAIVGTSIGGLLGAAYADGISVRELCDLAARFESATLSAFSGRRRTAQRNDRIGQFVREWFQATQVEELSIPTAIVTTDLDTCAPHVFTRGPLEVAIRASCAFPGLFKPVEHEGRMLADGCIVAPVPTAVAADECRLRPGRCVGSNAAGRLIGKRVQVFDPAHGLPRGACSSPPGPGMRTFCWSRKSTRSIGTISRAWTKPAPRAPKPCAARCPLCANCWIGDPQLHGGPGSPLSAESGLAL